jgi:hypothetical protein
MRFKEYLAEIYRADPDHSRRDIDWQNEIIKGNEEKAANKRYNLTDKSGKVLRVNLSLAAAKALQVRPNSWEIIFEECLIFLLFFEI